ncbi:MAG: hemolysin family protein, partial [Acidimicrobiales bacterium]
MTFAASFGGGDGALIATVIVLIALSAILALAETSLVRTSQARARSLVENKRHGARSLLRLVEQPERFLAPLLLIVLICQLVTATLVGVVASHLFGALGVAIGTVFEVVVIFVLAEAIPKQWAVRHPDRAALFAAPLVTAVIRFPPVRVVASALIGLSHLVTGKHGGEEEPDVTEDELLAMADVAAAEDVIEDEERELISSIIDFGDTIVREVMAPRPDVVAVEANSPASEVLEVAMSAGLSRIPVYAGSLDDVVGIAYTLDVVRAVREGGEDHLVSTFARPAHYVPETKRVAPLLREMQRDHFHLAVVVDEYGGTAGIVTLEDLLEELVGEITDEFDADDPMVEPLGDGAYRVSGRMAIDEVNELLGADLPVGDWDTVAGLFLHLSGHVPQEGESVEVDGYTLVAERVQRRRISEVRIARTASAAEGDGAA